MCTTVAPRTWAVVLLTATVLLFLGGVAGAEPRPIRPEHAVPVALFALVAVGGLAAWGTRRARRAVVVALVGSAGIGLALLSPRAPTGVAVFAAAIGAASVRPRWVGVALAACVGGGYLLAQYVVERSMAPINAAFQALALVATFSGVTAVQRIREERARAEQLLAELRASREAQVEAARLAERAHLAREIHDVLAHSLSALAVQLESARLLLEQRPGDPAAAAIVARAHGLARQGIEETRRAVAALRGESAPGPDLIRQLCRDFEAETGVPCRLEVEGDARPLGGDAGLALYRTAQEALTNARKHAEPASVEVRLTYEDDGVALKVEDVGKVATAVGDALAGSAAIRSQGEGRSAGESRPRLGERKGRARPGGGGYGLVGMRERAELLGGRLEAGPTARGFRVRLRLPA
jgi:signal transduction histidine kinase